MCVPKDVSSSHLGEAIGMRPDDGNISLARVGVILGYITLDVDHQWLILTICRCARIFPDMTSRDGMLVNDECRRHCATECVLLVRKTRVQTLIA